MRMDRPLVWLSTAISLIAALALNCASLGGRTRAATRLTEDFVELVALASDVADVTVLRATPQERNAAGLPLTVVTLQVNKVYKGGLLPGAETTAEFVGGCAGARNLICTGQPQLDPGDRAVLLLTRWPAGNPNWRVLAGDVGQIRVFLNEVGQCMAKRGEGRFNYQVRALNSGDGSHSVSCDVLSVERMDELLRMIVRTGQPVFEDEETVAAFQPSSSSSPSPAAAMLAPPDTATQDAAGCALLFKLLAALALTTGLWLVSRRVRRNAKAPA